MKGKAKSERAQCVIRLNGENKGGIAKAEAISGVAGILKVEVDPLNWTIVVDYDPTVITFEEIRERIKLETRKR